MKRLLAAALAVVAPAVALHAQDFPEYICQFTATPPVIDGRADDAVWSQAAPAYLVDVRFLSGDRFHEHPTEVRLLWDETNLYVYFKATDPDVWSVLEDRDANLWEDEVVEIFMDPDGDGANYAEIEVNSLNTVLDLLLSRPRGAAFWDWDAPLTTAVHVEGTVNDPTDQDEYWSMEMALPWTALVTDLLDVPGAMALPPEPGDQWRMNFYRYERVRDSEGKPLRIDYSAWSPVGEINFHRPDRFGLVTFARRNTAVEGSTWAQVKLLR